MGRKSIQERLLSLEQRGFDCFPEKIVICLAAFPAEELPEIEKRTGRDVSYGVGRVSHHFFPSFDHMTN